MKKSRFSEEQITCKTDMSDRNDFSHRSFTWTGAAAVCTSQQTFLH